MARKRVVRRAGTKAKVALAALSGISPSQIANRFGVHPTQVATWKKQLLEEAESCSPISVARCLPADEQELYEQIGRLQMELAWLKKKVAQVE